MGPAIADLGTGIGRDTGIAVNGTGIAGTVDTIGQGNFELLTGVRMAGRCKTVSANHTEATKGIIDPAAFACSPARAGCSHSADNGKSSSVGLRGVEQTYRSL
jgi:hypothetical protein